MKMKTYQSQSQGGNTFLKIADGETVKGVFVGDIYEFHTKWVNGKSIISTEDDPDAKIRFRCNFITNDQDDLVAKIWEFPLTIYEQLQQINEEYPLETTKVKITRTGTGTSTNYSIMPLVGPKDVLKNGSLEALSKIPLLNLKHKTPVFAAPSSIGQPDEELAF